MGSLASRTAGIHETSPVLATPILFGDVGVVSFSSCSPARLSGRTTKSTLSLSIRPPYSEFVFGTWPRTLRKNTGVATFWQRSSATSQTEEALLVLINMEGPVVLEML